MNVQCRRLCRSQSRFQRRHCLHHITVDQYSPHIIGTADNEVWMNGKYSLTVKGRNFGPVEQKGYLSSILVREGDAWKTRMLTWNVTPEPAATSSPTTTPSNK